MPAPIGDVADWTSKWSGTKQYAETYGSNALRYYYDPLLRVPRVRRDPLRPYDATALIGTPRFKSLPLTPDLMVWGERISGQAGGCSALAGNGGRARCIGGSARGRYLRYSSQMCAFDH